MFELLSDRYTKIFERPTPVISCDKTEITDAACPGFYDGYFIIKNIGGGILEGDIFAQSSFINFSTNSVEGNDVIIEFEIDLNHMRPGDSFLSKIVITTNGGQLVLSVNIFIEQFSVSCGEVKINSLHDFAEYVQKAPERAAELFISEEFMKWLINSKCAHTKLYKKLMEGFITLKEMDAFLIACGIKARPSIKPLVKAVEIEGDSNAAWIGENAETNCDIPLSIVNYGYFKYTVRCKNGDGWLNLSAKQITNDDFSDGGYVYSFRLIASKIPQPRASASIIFESGTERIDVPVRAVANKLFEAKLSRLSFETEDSGYLIIDNYTGRNAILEVSVDQSFVRFKAEKYIIERHSEIPFEIRVNNLLNLVIGRKPVNISKIHLRAVIDGKVFKEVFTVRAGSLLTDAL